jgi:hypothetical protein
LYSSQTQATARETFTNRDNLLIGGSLIGHLTVDIFDLVEASKITLLCKARAYVPLKPDTPQVFSSLILFKIVYVVLHNMLYFIILLYYIINHCFIIITLYKLHKYYIAYIRVIPIIMRKKKKKLYSLSAAFPAGAFLRRNFKLVFSFEIFYWISLLRVSSVYFFAKLHAAGHLWRTIQRWTKQIVPTFIPWRLE